MTAKNTAKLQTKVNEIIARWTAKGYTPQQILRGLYDWRAIMGEYKNGQYSLQIGMGDKATRWTL